DRDRFKAFYAAQSGLEKLTSDLGALFFQNVAPSESQIASLANGVPTIPDVKFVTTGEAAYGVTRLPPVDQAVAGIIIAGSYQGLMALKEVYEVNSSATTATGGEAHLKRKIETVAIPVFQFGIFSEGDISFSAADDFDFGGRVHTNANLFLAEGGSGNTL